MNTPSRTIAIQIGNNSYDVKFPNVGELIDIDVMKLRITNDKYESLKFSINPRFIASAIQAEAIATFSVLIPKLREDLTVKSFLHLKVEEAQTLVKAYTDQYLPW